MPQLLTCHTLFQAAVRTEQADCRSGVAIFPVHLCGMRGDQKTAAAPADVIGVREPNFCGVDEHAMEFAGIGVQGSSKLQHLQEMQTLFSLGCLLLHLTMQSSVALGLPLNRGIAIVITPHSCCHCTTMWPETSRSGWSADLIREAGDVHKPRRVKA